MVELCRSFFFFFIEMLKIWVEMEKKKSMAQDKGGN